MIDVALWVVALIVMVLIHRHAVKRQAARLETRAVMMDRQEKALRREAKRTQQDALKTLERVEHLHEDARLIYARVDAVLADPSVKRALRDIDG